MDDCMVVFGTGLAVGFKDDLSNDLWDGLLGDLTDDRSEDLSGDFIVDFGEEMHTNEFLSDRSMINESSKEEHKR